MKTKESDIQKNIISYLRLKGFYAQRINCGMTTLMYKGVKRVIRGADKGTPDVLACIYGKFIGIEIKNGIKEVEKFHKKIENCKIKGPLKSYKREIDQDYQHSKIRKADGIAWVVGSVAQLQVLISKEFEEEPCSMKH